VVAVNRDQVDLAKPESIRACVRSNRPELIVNAAAYTAVDRAESEEGLATAINANAPALLASEAAWSGALLVHFSTDYVFDGEKSSPYIESDDCRPLNAYGRSKLAGDQAVQAAGCRHLIFRTCWVYAAAGKNFLLTMLRLALSGKEVRVVDDQVGAPTSNLMIASAVAQAIRRALQDESISGLFHLSARGQTTWHGFAREIFRAKGISAPLKAIPTSEYPTLARRPHNSVLDNGKLERQFDLRLASWDAGVREVLASVP
jgi:dTDP-4-dehydrorhamnose reductase